MSSAANLEAARKAWPLHLFADKRFDSQEAYMNACLGCEAGLACTLHAAIAQALDEAEARGWNAAIGVAADCVPPCDCDDSWTLRNHHAPECTQEWQDDVLALASSDDAAREGK